ncbi:hypothetical protein QJS66_18405 [Kocuria rhizophila]|nr:hypothetical protein QJS66_18405 [Kocuria rhizophila]
MTGADGRIRHTRIALFATCIVGSPCTPRRRWPPRILERLGTRSCSPRAGLLLADARQQRVLPGRRAGHPQPRAPSPAWTTTSPWHRPARARPPPGHQQPMVARECGEDALAEDAEMVAGEHVRALRAARGRAGVTDPPSSWARTLRTP